MLFYLLMKKFHVSIGIVAVTLAIHPMQKDGRRRMKSCSYHLLYLLYMKKLKNGCKKFLRKTKDNFSFLGTIFVRQQILLSCTHFNLRSLI